MISQIILYKFLNNLIYIKYAIYLFYPAVLLILLEFQKKNRKRYFLSALIYLLLYLKYFYVNEYIFIISVCLIVIYFYLSDKSIFIGNEAEKFKLFYDKRFVIILLVVLFVGFVSDNNFRHTSQFFLFIMFLTYLGLLLINLSDFNSFINKIKFETLGVIIIIMIFELLNYVMYENLDYYIVQAVMFSYIGALYYYKHDLFNLVKINKICTKHILQISILSMTILFVTYMFLTWLVIMAKMYP